MQLQSRSQPHRTYSKDIAMICIRRIDRKIEDTLGKIGLDVVEGKELGMQLGC
jgi:hypothetical protein